MYKAILFDFDGVIIESELPTFKLIQAVLKKRGVEIRDEHFTKKIGRTTKSFLQEAFGDVLSPYDIEDAVEEFLTEYRGNIMNHAIPIHATIDFIKGYTGNLRFAIASMSQIMSIEKILTHYGIREKFSIIVTRDDIIHHKPHPEVYLKAADLLELQPEDCLVIEDSVIGATAAKNAGMNCYIVRNTYNTNETFAGLTVQGILETSDDYKKMV